MLVDVLGYAIILPLLPFFAEHFGASPTVVGILVSAYAVCQFIAGPVLGQISDRVGRKPVLIVSQIGTFISFLILANAWALWVVFLARILDGLTAGNLSLAQAYISDVTRPAERSKSYALIGIAFGIGFLIGPAIAGALVGVNPNAPFYAAATLSFGSILCTTFLLPAKPERPALEPGEEEAPGTARLGLFDLAGYAKFFVRPGLSVYLWQFFFFAFAFSGFVGAFALFAQARLHFGPREVGYTFAYVGLLGIVIQGGLIRALVKHLGDKGLVFTGFIASVIGYAGIGLTFNWKMLLFISIFSSYGTGALRAAITSLVTQAGGRREQGVLLGLTQSITSVCQIVAPLISGILIDHQLLTTWAMMLAVTAAAGVATSLPRGRPSRKAVE